MRACDSWVADVKWAPSILATPHILATAGYDGKIKYWDIRSTKPLHEIATNSERLYGLDWSPVIDRQSASDVVTTSLVGGTGKVLDRISWKITV